MTRKEAELQQRLGLHDRGAHRMAAQHGQDIYVNAGELYYVDESGTITTPASIDDGQTTASGASSFGSWTEVSASRPSWVLAEATVETDGTSRGEVTIEVDEDGDGTAEYDITVAHVDPDNASGAIDKGSTRVYVPAGGQYRFTNASDPNTNNTLGDVRELEG